MNEDFFIVGINGLIGSSLVEAAERNGISWIGTSRKTKSNQDKIIKLDLLSDEDIQNLAVRPKITYLCAGETNIRACQDAPLETRKINVEQTVKLARHLHQAGSHIVFISTNLVFDGSQPYITPEARPSPTIEYGRQKVEAEIILANSLEHVSIIRLTKVVHQNFALFKEWLSALRQGFPIRPFSDMYLSPVDIAYVVDELMSLRYSLQSGVFQLSGDQDISYASAANILARCHSIDPGLIRPQTTVEAGFQQHSPKHTTLAHKPVRPNQGTDSAVATLERIFKSFL